MLRTTLTLPNRSEQRCVPQARRLRRSAHRAALSTAQLQNRTTRLRSENRAISVTIGRKRSAIGQHPTRESTWRTSRSGVVDLHSRWHCTRGNSRQTQRGDAIGNIFEGFRHWSQGDFREGGLHTTLTPDPTTDATLGDPASRTRVPSDMFASTFVRCANALIIE